jgi:hypothetical protein
MLEIGLMLYFLIGLALYLRYLEDIKAHSETSVGYIRRIIYIVTFIVTVLLWPLIIGA